MSIPQRSEAGKYAEDIFYGSVNSLNLYFEDADQENLYCEIVKRCLPDRRISKVFTLNGKTSLISHSNDPANNVIENRFYIVDRDFSAILGMPGLGERFLVLDRFCIENYLLDDGAIMEVIIENTPKLDLSKIRDNLKVNEYLSEIEGYFCQLFFLFLACQSLSLPIKNTSLPPERFFESSVRHKPCNEKLQRFSSDIASACEEKYGNSDIDALIDSHHRDRFRDASLHEKVSGKFMLSAAFLYVKSKYSLGVTTYYSFVYRVMKNSDLNDLKDFFGRHFS